MKYMVERVREYINRKTVRARMRKAISILCCVVVFVTTYALILPSLALEKTVICGKEEHEHTADCYTRELVCGQEESEAHQHTDECYEDVLTCGKEVHVHTLDCYEAEEPEEEEPAQEPEEPAVEETAQEPAAEETDEPEETAAPEETVEEEEEEEQETPAVEEPQEQEPEDDPVEEQVEEKSDSGKTEKADKADTSKEEKKKEEVAEPEKLGKIDFADLLTNDTDVYYLPENAGSDDWEAIDGNVKLDPEETVILHIAYEIPAGELNATNTETEYYLPIEIAMSDKEVEAVNKYQSTIFDGTDRKSDDLKKAGEFEIEEKTNDKGEVTERKLVIRFNDYAAGKVGGEKLTDGTVTAKPEKIEGFLELSVSAADLLTLERVDDAAYKLEWNDDDRLDTTVHFDEEKLAAFENQDKEETADETAKKDEKEQSEKKQPEKKVVIQEIEEEKPAETEAPAQEQTEETAKTEEAAEEVKYASGRLTFNGGSYTVTADFDESAKLPEGVQLKATELQGATYDMYLNKAQDAVDEGKEVTGARFFDITFVNTNGEPVEPQGMVDVKIQYKNSETIDKDANVEGLHFTEEGAENVDVETKGIADNHVDVVTFQSDSFSVYGILYTVDFEIVNPETGKVYTYSLEGGKSINLTELLVILGIKSEDEVEKFVAEEVTDVKFSDPELVKVTHKGKFLGLFGTEDWLLESLQPFSTEETLTIMLRDGGMITVKVTDEQSTAMGDFLIDAKIDIEGTIYGKDETWNVREGVAYELILAFKENGSLQLPDGGTELTLEPKNLGGMALIPGQTGEFDIPMGLYGTVTGNTWWVDDSGKLHLRLGPDPDNLLSRSNNTFFDFGFRVKFSGEEGKIEFNDKVEREWKADTSTDVDIKKNGQYDAASGKMKYTVTVTSTGNSKNVRIQDTFSNNNLLTLDQGSITISPAKELDESESQTSASGFTRVIREMSHGETVTITYTADVNESALGPGGKPKGDDGKNTITVDNGDKTDTDINIVNEIKYSDLSKTSVSSEELPNDKVRLNWKIDANTNRIAPIVGGKISDTIQYESRNAMKYETNSNGEVVLHVVGTDANGTEYSKDIKVTPSDNQGQESWAWVVENLGEPEGTALSYTITYSTIVTKQANTLTVKNDSTNEDGGNDTGVGVVPGTGGGGPTPSIVTTKEATNVTEEYIDWNIVIDVPADGFDRLEVVDTLPGMWLNNYFGKDIIEEPISDVKIEGLVENECPDIQYKKNGTYTNDVLKIVFYKDSQKSEPGLNKTARTITIKIRTKNDSEWLRQVSEENCDYASNHKNVALVNNYQISAIGTPLKKKVEKKCVTKYEENGLPCYEYQVILSRVESVEDFSFNDTFNSEYLELVPPESYQEYSTESEIGGNDLPWEWKSNPDHSYIQYEITEPGTIHFYANSLPTKSGGKLYAYYRIVYYLRVKDVTALEKLKKQAIAHGGKFELKNTAVWGTLPSECTVEYETKPITKEGFFASTNPYERKYTFVIDVNADEYTVGDGETVELKDQHTDNLSVDYSSIKIYKIPTGTTIADAKAAVQNNQLDESWLLPKGAIPFNFNANEGDFTLADKTHYIITYNAVVIGGGKQDFQNTADLNGFISYKKDGKDYSGEAHGGGQIWEIKLLKYKDGLTSNGLEGTTFQLFKGTGEYIQVTDEEGNTWYEEQKEPMKYGNTAVTRQKGIVGENITFTTGEDGTALIAVDQVHDGNQLEGGVHYFLKEIDAPPGYQIDQSTEYWAFTLTDDPDEVNYGDPDRRDEYGNRQWIYFYYNDILKMANTETHNPLDVVVNKYWFDKEGKPITGENLNEEFVATVQLLRKTDDGDYVPVKVEYNEAGETVVTDLPAGDTSGQVALNKGNEWSYRWKDLPRVKMKEPQKIEVEHRYAYKIEEVNVDGYVVSMSESENENIKTYALNNYEKPEEKETSITVTKEWQDYEGNLIETSEKLPPEINFRLYRVTSTTPFTGTPSTGGELYVIANDDRLVNKDAVEGDDNYGVYKLTKDDDWKTVFSDLPEIRTDTDGKTYYYAYYVKELPITGYTTTYTSNGETRTIINREPRPEGDYINIGLEKKWKNGDDTTPPRGASATFTVHQQKSTKTGEDGTIQVTITQNGETTNSIKCNPGDTLSISVSGNPYQGDNLNVNGNYYTHVNINGDGLGATTYKVPENYSSQVINFSSANNILTFTSITSNGEQGASYSDYEDTGVTKEITLPHGSSWSYTFKNLVQRDEDGNLYKYYITEDSCTPEAIGIQFKDKNGTDIKDATISTGNQTKPIGATGTSDEKVEVTNTYEELFGALKITKAVTLNGEPTRDSRLNGVYSFEIWKDNAKVEKDAEGKDIGNLSITIKDGIPDPEEIVVGNLKPGSYTIKETASDNDGVTIDDDKTITVEAGDTIPATAIAAFTNDYETTEFEFEKEWRGKDGTTIAAWPENVESIEVTVERRIGEETERIGVYTINKNGTNTSDPATAPKLVKSNAEEYKYKLADLPKKGKIREATGEYTYYVQEKKVDGYKDPIYANPSSGTTEDGTEGNTSVTTPAEALNGGKIINTPEEAYDLPHTGGFGTTPFYTIGLLLIAFAAGLYTYLNRKNLIALRSDRRTSGTGRGKNHRRGGGGLL